MNKFFLALLTTTQIFTAVCSEAQATPSIATKADGTADAGGGTVEKSTEADVRAAVDEALLILTDAEFFEKLSRARIYSSKRLSEHESAQLYRIQRTLSYPPYAAIFPLLEGNSRDDSDADLENQRILVNKYSKKTLIEYIDKSKIYFLDRGSCPASDKTNADASVSEFDLNAKICFSLENLKNIPRESLLKHVTGLWAHEIGHMFGFQEDVVVLLQNRIVEAFDQIHYFSGVRMPSVIRSYIWEITGALDYVVFMLEMDEGATLNNVVMTKSIKISQLRYKLGFAAGLNTALLEIFNNRSAAPPLFKKPEIQTLIAKSLPLIQSFNEFLKESFNSSDEQVLSHDYLISLRAQTQLMNEIQKIFETVQHLQFSK